ncbi:Uncharacterised protein [Vibrio cholerae]|nr:Uncharacterised protein [Vibrio cholerae]
MTQGTAGPNGDIHGASTNINHTDPKLALVFRNHCVASRQTGIHQLFNF